MTTSNNHETEQIPSQMITACLTQSDADYEKTLQLMTAALGDSGSVARPIVEFIRRCLDEFEVHGCEVPQESGEFGTEKLWIKMRPKIAIVQLKTAEPNFRERVLSVARDCDLTALDHQNGYLLVPPGHYRKPWWKFWAQE